MTETDIDETKEATAVKEMFKISVRELVAFSCFAPDIMPATDTDALLTGAQAHRSRQEDYAGETEKTIKYIYELHGAKVQVYGRMDAFVDGEIPFIEEIKLCRLVRRQYVMPPCWRKKRTVWRFGSAFAM